LGYPDGINPFAGYDNMLAEAFLGGHLYLPVEPRKELLALADPYDPVQNAPYRMGDASLYRGKYYLNWGPTPALVLFLPFRALTGRYFPQTMALALFGFLGVVATTGVVLFLGRRTPGWMLVLAAATLGFANAVPYVLRRVFVYEVSVTCAYGMMAAAVYCFVTGALGERPRLKRVALGSLLVGLAAGARPPMLLGIGLGLVVTWRLLRGERWGLALAALLGPFAVCVGLLGLYNYLRFDSWTDFGYQYILTTTQNNRLYPLFQWRRIPLGLELLFLEPPTLSLDFPFWLLEPRTYWEPPKEFCGAPVAGILVGTPVVNLLLLLPFVWWGLRRATATTVAALAALGLGVAVFVSGAVCPQMRYVLYLAGLLQTAALLVWFHLSSWLGRGVRVAGAALAVYGIVFHVFISFTGYDDSFVWGSPRAYRAIEGFFTPLQEACLRVSGLRYGPVRMRVQFAAAEPGTSVPLVVTGQTWAGDFAFARYETAETVVFGLDHWGHPARWSRPVKVRPGQTYEIEVHMGSLYPASPALLARLFPGASLERVRREFVVRLDGQEVMREESEFYRSGLREVTIGENRIGGSSCGPRFIGKVLEARRADGV
jgi:hypothetical protein